MFFFQLAEKFDTGAAYGECDKYQVWTKAAPSLPKFIFGRYNSPFPIYLGYILVTYTKYTYMCKYSMIHRTNSVNLKLGGFKAVVGKHDEGQATSMSNCPIVYFDLSTSSCYTLDDILHKLSMMGGAHVKN